MNLLKKVKGSPPPAASDVRCFAAFCELRKTHTSPPSEEMVAQRSSMFKNTATYYNYVRHLKNARTFLRLPTAWHASEVSHTAKGIEKCHDKSSNFRNFSRCSIILQLVERPSMQDEFAKACMLSFLFALRVRSETLARIRAFRNDQLMEFPPQDEKDLINAVSIGDEQFLVAKSPRREI